MLKPFLISLLYVSSCGLALLQATRESTPQPIGLLIVAMVMTPILVSIIAVLLESVPAMDEQFHFFFEALEWLITIAFTIEYAIRLRVVGRPTQYAFSFFGIVGAVPCSVS